MHAAIAVLGLGPGHSCLPSKRVSSYEHIQQVYHVVSSPPHPETFGWSNSKWHIQGCDPDPFESTAGAVFTLLC